MLLDFSGLTWSATGRSADLARDCWLDGPLGAWQMAASLSLAAGCLAAGWLSLAAELALRLLLLSLILN